MYVADSREKREGWEELRTSGGLKSEAGRGGVEEKGQHLRDFQEKEDAEMGGGVLEESLL